MAAVTAANTSAYGFTTPAGPTSLPTMSGGSGEVIGCFFACTFAGTYVQSTGYTLSAASDIGTAISNARRDGKTITVKGVEVAAPGLEGTTSPAVVMPGTAALSAGNATGLLYGPDGTTEHAAAAMVAFARPCTFWVTFTAQ